MFMVTVYWGGTAALLTLCFSGPALLFATISTNKPAPGQGQGGRVDFPAGAEMHEWGKFELFRLNDIGSYLPNIRVTGGR